ncbi:hypothetical protein CAS74_001813 [Pichia kudriavzevii]|uniref:Uncharacterized protein n=1 Tax=Pichia kudriavzevii TaxID=4909 RepID=A0A1Z8JSC0_PICKU|nr:hypothetical protein CAS74_001813 [Pichia kudriavzevii]
MSTEPDRHEIATIRAGFSLKVLNGESRLSGRLKAFYLTGGNKYAWTRKFVIDERKVDKEGLGDITDSVGHTYIPDLEEVGNQEEVVSGKHVPHIVEEVVERVIEKVVPIERVIEKIVIVPTPATKVDFAPLESLYPNITFEMEAEEVAKVHIEKV